MARGRRVLAAALVVAGLGAAAAMVAAVAAPRPVVPTPPPSASTVVTPTAAATPAATSAATSAVPAPRVLRVYSNNIENLVEDTADGCAALDPAAHLASMLVDDAGRAGTPRVREPDLLLLQQLGGREQAQAYADAVSAAFGRPAGTFKALVAWDEPGEWGEQHGCDQPALAAAKSRQTNGIIYNTGTLTLDAVPVRWSAGWLRPGTRYDQGAGCTPYQPPSFDADPLRREKWKRTSALAARFTVAGSGTTVFAATLHLPHHNRAHACAGDGDPGLSATGVRLAPAAEELLAGSAVRVLGVDANRTGIAPDALTAYGVSGHGEGATVGRRTKIDYLFARGAVRPSPIGHTVAGTRSTHRALYAFLDLSA